MGLTIIKMGTQLGKKYLDVVSKKQLDEVSANYGY